MAKIRNITPKQWDKFEKERLAKGMTPLQYFDILLNTDREIEHVGAAKEQMQDSINAMGKAKDELEKQKKKGKDLAVTINELI